MATVLRNHILNRPEELAKQICTSCSKDNRFKSNTPMLLRLRRVDSKSDRWKDFFQHV